MNKKLVGALCAGLGAVAGAALGDLLELTYAFRVAAAGLGGGIGGLLGAWYIQARNNRPSRP